MSSETRVVFTIMVIDVVKRLLQTITFTWVHLGIRTFLWLPGISDVFMISNPLPQLPC